MTEHQQRKADQARDLLELLEEFAEEQAFKPRTLIDFMNWLRKKYS